MPCSGCGPWVTLVGELLAGWPGHAYARAAVALGCRASWKSWKSSRHVMMPLWLLRACAALSADLAICVIWPEMIVVLARKAGLRNEMPIGLLAGGPGGADARDARNQGAPPRGAQDDRPEVLKMSPPHGSAGRWGQDAAALLGQWLKEVALRLEQRMLLVSRIGMETLGV